MKKVYLSGPVTAERFLKNRGYSVINPVKVNFALPDDTTYEEYMKILFAMLDICESIYFLEGWKNSKGAIAEYHYAKALGKEILNA